MTYINARGKLLDKHTVEATKRNGDKESLTAETIVIAVGGRPRYLGVPGKHVAGGGGRGLLLKRG